MGGIQKGFREKAVGRRIRLNSDGRQDVRKTDWFAEKRMRGPPPCPGGRRPVPSLPRLGLPRESVDPASFFYSFKRPTVISLAPFSAFRKARLAPLGCARKGSAHAHSRPRPARTAPNTFIIERYRDTFTPVDCGRATNQVHRPKVKTETD